MNVTQQAQQAYAPTQLGIRTDRSVEAQLISQITARLRKATAEQAQNYPAFMAAIHDNRRMWTTMAAEVAGKDNGLPAPLRAQIFYLAEFTEHQSQRVIRGKADPEALIAVNTAVMRGLNGQVPT